MSKTAVQRLRDAITQAAEGDTLKHPTARIALRQQTMLAQTAPEDKIANRVADYDAPTLPNAAQLRKRLREQSS